MRKLMTACIWVVAVALGLGGSQVYQRFVAEGVKPDEEHVKEREAAWKKATGEGSHPPPPVIKRVLRTVPRWQHKVLQKKFAELDATYQPAYLDTRTARFEGAWEVAVEDGADAPEVGAFLPDEKDNKDLHDKLKEKLTKLDATLRVRYPRIRLALDSFSGYCVFRSPEFLKRLKKERIKIHLVDDDADYEKRSKALKSGEAPLAVFTVDALIQNSFLLGGDPFATIVMIIDETRGADAMFADKQSLPSLAALNRNDIKIILTENSPSETLARVVRSKFSMPLMPRIWAVRTKGPDEVAARFRASRPGEPHAFVLWEPYVSKLLKERPNAHVLIDSKSFPGYIVDVLVVNREYLQNNRETVEKIVKAYLEAAKAHQSSVQDMVNLVVADSEKLVKTKKLDAILTPEEAAKVVQGIWWKDTRQNYAHFGLDDLPKSKTPFLSLEEMIKNMNAVLINVDAIARKVPAAKLYDKSIVAKLKEEGFDAGNGLPPPKEDPENIANLVAALKVDPIHFPRGSAEISDDLSKQYLEDLAGVLKTKPRYHLEIRGHALGDTAEDRALAAERARAVKMWLETNGGISANRLRAQADDDKSGKSNRTGAAVTFLLLEGPPGGSP